MMQRHHDPRDGAGADPTAEGDERDPVWPDASTKGAPEPGSEPEQIHWGDEVLLLP